ncbi:unnamed protein product [Closterium sp. NIES-54]
MEDSGSFDTGGFGSDDYGGGNSDFGGGGGEPAAFGGGDIFSGGFFSGGASMNQPQIFEDDAGRTDTGSFDPPPAATGGGGGDGGGGGAASWIAPVAAGLGGFALGHMTAGGGGGGQWGGGGSPWHRDSGCRHDEYEDPHRHHDHHRHHHHDHPHRPHPPHPPHDHDDPPPAVDPCAFRESVGYFPPPPAGHSPSRLPPRPFRPPSAQPGAVTPWGHGGGARRWPAHPVVAHSGRFPEERYRRPRPPMWMVVMKWLPWVAVAVAVWLYVFAYASTSVDLHPHEHHMLPRFSPFVAGVQVSPLALMPSPPPVLVTFTRYPPIVNEEWATGRPNVRVEPYSYRSWLFHFNKWSQITLSFSGIRSYLPLDLLVIEGSSQMDKFKTDPRAFTGALRKYFLSGDDAVTFQVPRDNDYYFVPVNYNAYPATVALVHFEVTSVLYDISKGKKACKIRNKHPAPLGSSNGTDGMLGKTLTNARSAPMRMPMPMLMPTSVPTNDTSAVVPRSTAELMPSAADAENVSATYTTDGGAITDSDDDDDDDDNGFCSAKLPLWETRYVVLAAPKHMACASGLPATMDCLLDPHWLVPSLRCLPLPSLSFSRPFSPSMPSGPPCSTCVSSVFWSGMHVFSSLLALPHAPYTAHTYTRCITTAACSYAACTVSKHCQSSSSHAPPLPPPSLHINHPFVASSFPPPLAGIPCLLSLIALSIYRCQLYLQHRSDSMRQSSSLASITTDPSPLPSSSPSEHHPLLASSDSPPLYTPPDQATAAACSDVCTAVHSQAPIPDTWAVTITTDALPGSSAPSAPPLETSPGKAQAGTGSAGQGSEAAGGSGSGVGKVGEGEDKDSNCCCVCMENPRNAVILDCGHRATCYSCGQELMRMANKRCPICRREVRDVTRIYDA